MTAEEVIELQPYVESCTAKKIGDRPTCKNLWEGIHDSIQVSTSLFTPFRALREEEKRDLKDFRMQRRPYPRR
jgi:hypothetical protein